MPIAKSRVFMGMGMVLGATVGWRWWPRQPSPAGRVPETVRLALGKTPTAAPVFIAETQQFFRRSGLDVSITTFQSSREALAALIHDEADLATAADTAIVFGLLNRQDFALVTTLTVSNRMARILTRTDTGIMAPVDLHRRVVGARHGTIGYFELASALWREGLLPADVTVIDAKPATLPTMLHQGEVEAIAVWEPYASIATALLQGNAVELPASGVYRASVNLVVRRTFAAQRAEAVRRVVRALDAAVQFIHANDRQAHQYVSRWINPRAPVIEQGWREYTFTLGLDQTLLLTLEDIARWAVRSRLAEDTSVPNFLHHMAFDALEHVRPDAITIMR